MKLSFEEIKSISVGAVDIWSELDGVHYSKCTKAQLSVWESLGGDLLRNAKATTGVRLDFHTNSKFIKVKLGSFGKYEVKVNEVLKEQYVFSEENQKKEIMLVFDDNNDNHIVISLPSHREPGVISEVEIDNGAFIRPHIFDRKFLFLGDSITQGYASKYDFNSYAYQISHYYNAESVIQGIGGSFFVPETVMSIGYNPDVIFIAYGTNDFMCLKSLDELKNKVKAYIKALKSIYTDTKLIAITPIWRKDKGELRAMGVFKDCCDCIKKAMLELDVKIIYGDKLVPPLNEFMADSIHPNDLGFFAYTLNLLDQLQDKI